VLATGLPLVAVAVFERRPAWQASDVEMLFESFQSDVSSAFADRMIAHLCKKGNEHLQRIPVSGLDQRLE
jgi:hypothetical protein